MSIYMDNIIDLYKNPLNSGQLDDASVSYRAHNPLCGDDITVDLLIVNDSINDVKQRGVGCAISQAAISLLTEEIKHKSLNQVLAIEPDEVVEMLGIELGPVRLKCALLGLEAIKTAIHQYRNPSSS